MKKIVMLSVLCLSLVFSLYASDWSGRYIWVNSTDKDNGGKMASLEFVVKWMIYQIETTDNESITTMKVSAFNFKVDVKITFSFSLDENGKEQLTFWMDTDLSLADGMFFKNPEPESNGRFVLVKQ